MEKKIVEVKCIKCGCEQSYIKIMGLYETGNCVQCGEITYFKRAEGYDAPIKYSTPVSKNIECPYCHSTNTKKISGLSKASRVALFGVFAIGKVTKQWHCNNCKSDF